MKKKALVAAVLAATTLTATPAFAAQNPFKDMPEGHWAYDAVNMLVKDGVVEGYGDGTFGGDKLMNRYEMAEIVANAAKKYGSVGMKDKGAIKKLQREFKAELKDMDARLAGVEQDVAQLKKGQSSFKWFGDARFRYMQNKKMEMKSTQPKQWQLEKRVRLGLWGEPAKNISVEGRLKYEDEFMKHDGWGGNNQSLWDGNNSNQSSFRLDKLGVTWRNAGTAVSVGRIETSLGQGSLFWENPIDGVNVSHQFGPKLNVMVGYGDISAAGWQPSNVPSFYSNVKYQASPATQFTFSSMHTNTTMASPTTSFESNYYYYDDDGNQVQVWKPWNTYSKNGQLCTWVDGKGDVPVIAEGGSNKTTWYDTEYKLNQYALGINTQITPKWNVIVEGIRNNVSGNTVKNKNGLFSRLTYGHLVWNKGKTWDIYGEYFALGNAAVDSQFWGHHYNFAGGNSNFKGGSNTWGDGARGWGLTGEYMLAANYNIMLSYYSIKPYDSNSAGFSRYQDVILAALTCSF